MNTDINLVCAELRPWEGDEPKTQLGGREGEGERDTITGRILLFVTVYFAVSVIHSPWVLDRVQARTWGKDGGRKSCLGIVWCRHLLPYSSISVAFFFLYSTNVSSVLTLMLNSIVYGCTLCYYLGASCE